MTFAGRCIVLALTRETGKTCARCVSTVAKNATTRSNGNSRRKLAVAVALGTSATLLSVSAWRTRQCQILAEDSSEAQQAGWLRHRRPVDRKEEEISPAEIRFKKFASLEFDGEAYMAPMDFLDSMIQKRPRPRLKAKILSEKDIAKILDATPMITEYVKKHKSDDPDFFRSHGDKGLISFPEYMFLLSIMTRPRSGFRVAFDVIDASRENTILRSEFARFVLMASAHKGTMYRSFPVGSTLKTHFFGRDGKHHLKFAEFEGFIEALQREVLLVEFLEYSRGIGHITEQDFAHLLLRYTDLTQEEQDAYYDMLDGRLAPETERPGVSFPELETFIRLLSNLEDFSLAFRLYPKAGRSMSKPEFSRAAKVSLGGSELSPHLVDVIFALFDKAGDGALSHDEFFTVLTNRQKRRLGRIGMRADETRPWAKRFAKCVRRELRKAPEQQIRMDV